MKIIAYDGKECETVQQCLNYEISLKNQALEHFCREQERDREIEALLNILDGKTREIEDLVKYYYQLTGNRIRLYYVNNRLAFEKVTDKPPA